MQSFPVCPVRHASSPVGQLSSRRTNKELVRAAWDEDEYHPLRHDGKLHVAVRKLRETIEDDPKKPIRLATTDDGYRLGGPVRRC